MKSQCLCTFFLSLFDFERLFLARVALFVYKHCKRDAGTTVQYKMGKKSGWKEIVDLLTCLRESATLIENMLKQIILLGNTCSRLRRFYLRERNG